VRPPYIAAPGTPDNIAREQSCCQPWTVSSHRDFGRNGDKNARSQAIEVMISLTSTRFFLPGTCRATHFLCDGRTMIDAITPPRPSHVQNRALQVASSFTSRPLAAKLRPFLAGAGVADGLQFVEYGQIAEYMLGPASDAEHIIGTLVLVRVEDWLRNELKNGHSDSDLSQKARQTLTAHVDEFVKQITALALRGKPVWLLLCPSNGWIAESHMLAPLCRTYTNLVLARVRSTPGVTVLNWPSSLTGPEVSDRNTDRLGQIPFTPAAFQQLSQFIGPEIETHLASRTANAGTASSKGKSDLAKFLAGLEVRVRLFAPQRGDRAHVDRILRTAAAFSLTGEKRDLSDAEVDRIVESGGCLLVTVSDRLSTYGPSGVISSRIDQDSLVVEELALSCPVLGKQVEYAVIVGLAQIGSERAYSRLVFEYTPSGRNQIMLKFLESIGDPVRETRFSLPAAEANERIRKTAVAPGTWTLESEGNLLCAKNSS